MILLAVEDLERDAPVRDLLTAEGWWVTTVASKEEALRAAADHAPQLLVLDRGMDDTASLFKVFARARGGCGVLALVDSLSEEGAGDIGDGVVARDQEADDIVATVRGSLDAPRAAQDSPPVEDQPASAEDQLTARELFGDILEGLGETKPEVAETSSSATAEAPSGDEAPGDQAAVGEVPGGEIEGEAADLVLNSRDALEEATEEPPQEGIPQKDTAAGLEDTPSLATVVETSEERREDPGEGSEAAERPIEAVLDEVLREVPGMPEEPEEPPEEQPAEAPEEPSVEVPVPPDVAAADRLKAELSERVERLAEPEQEARDPEDSRAEAGAEPAEAESSETESSETESSETESSETEGSATEAVEEEIADVDAATDFEPLSPASRELEDSLLADEELVDGDPTTDLVEEVADLLESGHKGWPATEEPESGEGLSIDDVLAVETSLAAGEPSEETEPEAQLEADQEADYEPEPALPSEQSEQFERLGPYELLELAEFGDLTERWLARRVGGDSEKVILERVRQELRTRADVRDAFVEGNSDAAGWEHENVIAVVDLGRQDDIDFVATEYRPGHSLAEVLDRVARMEARMPLGVSLLLIERIAAALEVLAESPAISRHGWLVPNSIWLGENGEVLLREFGLGRLATPDPSVVRDWTEHRFIAPEKWSNRGDIRSDLYSLGAVLYEMVCGRGVHRAADYEALESAIQNENIAPAQEVDPTIPSEIDAWMMRLLRRNPQDRPQSVPEIIAKIDLALQALPARPANAELNAYVRQLFAARVPDLPSPKVQALPTQVPVVEADSETEIDARPGRRWEWWWLLIPLLALLSTFVGWKFLSRDRVEAEFEDRRRPRVELATAVPESTSPQYSRLQ